MGFGLHGNDHCYSVTRSKVFQVGEERDRYLAELLKLSAQTRHHEYYREPVSLYERNEARATN